MSTVNPLLLGYPSLLDTVCPLLLGRYLSVCYWACVYQLLVTVCPSVVGWFMSMHCWLLSVHYYKVSSITGYSLSIIVG